MSKDNDTNDKNLNTDKNVNNDKNAGTGNNDNPAGTEGTGASAPQVAVISALIEEAENRMAAMDGNGKDGDKKDEKDATGTHRKADDGKDGNGKDKDETEEERKKREAMDQKMKKMEEKTASLEQALKKRDGTIAELTRLASAPKVDRLVRAYDGKVSAPDLKALSERFASMSIPELDMQIAMVKPFLDAQASAYAEESRYSQVPVSPFDGAPRTASAPADHAKALEALNRGLE